MKNIFFFIICLGIQILILTGCSLFCTLEPPPYGYFIKINLLDKNTGQSLMPLRDSGYYADSVVLEMRNPFRNYRMVVNSRDTILASELISPGNFFADTLFFRYRTTKVDTIIVFSHNEHERACGERFSVIKID